MNDFFLYLDNQFAPILTVKAASDPVAAASFEKFIAELKKQQLNPTVSRLTVCIATVVKVKNAEASHYFDLIAKMDWSISHSLPEIFHKASCDPSFYKTLLPDDECPNFDDQYVRVMSLSTFERVYLPSIEDSVLGTGNPDDLTAEEIFFNSDLEIPFRNAGRSMRGAKECAWVLPHKPLKTIVNDQYQGDWADIFVDRAGFYVENFPSTYIPGKSLDPKFRYIYLLYPEDFAETVCKPTAIHADWSGPKPYPYISSAHMDGWGQTYNMDLLIDPAETFSERIHLPFMLFSSTKNGNNYAITGYGGSSLKKKHDFPNYQDEALGEAIFRFKNIY